MNKIRYYRARENFSQRKLASIVGVEKTTVSKWETGVSMPRADLLPKIAEALRCTIDELLERDSA